ncbi:2-hydroxyacyl-CoA dehydratase [Petroclostridium xylanilyticum]|jgi:predicted nucleotide-binding protein (sugar kinase/HSP70/actin superfamily)|uniref:2-hydroxyacyl-CoA dehydratase n=1 Tax=Petroclostridium xylanilyticum TaxID=1792311 RepID=UPI000B9946B3|nr:2-hydroxyacyl-CoA dehydratase [Petroclostridium xylanilyticum]
MKVTFPHMGNTCIVVKALFEYLDIDFITPPVCSKRTLELGTKYAPELACLPLKINIGNFIESIEKGADTIVMAGGCGPCRFGYYAEVQREILKDLGYNVDLFVLELPNGDIQEFLRRVRKLIGRQSLWKALIAIKKATKVSIELDQLDKLSFQVRPREKVKGKTDWIMRKFQHQVSKVKGPENIIRLINETRKELEAIETDPSIAPLKIGIVGEIYTVIEPFTNFKIEQLLGSMGIEVDRSLNVSHWIVEHMIKQALHLRKHRPYEEAAQPYLSTMIGGHAQDTIGNSVLYARQGYDGVIQLYPFTCMPEIVAESILPAVSNDLDIPILTLIIDELTGEAGYKTRIEAFVDMLARRKERKLRNNEYVLSGN